MKILVGCMDIKLNTSRSGDISIGMRGLKGQQRNWLFYIYKKALIIFKSWKIKDGGKMAMFKFVDTGYFFPT